MHDNSIDELALPMRVRNCLFAEDIFTIEALMDLSSAHILKIKGISRNSLKIIEEELDIYKNKINNKNTMSINLEQLEKIVSKETYKAMAEFFKNGLGYKRRWPWSHLPRTCNNTCYKIVEDLIKTALTEMKTDIESNLFRNTNELRTLVLEQSRILEGLQSINRPDGIVHKISEKIPGFSHTIYELHKLLSKNE
jgi:hypothetical protein